MQSSQFWSLINSTPSNTDWGIIADQYVQNKKRIDIDYEPPSAPGESILWLICLKQKFLIADIMVKHKPNADFTKAPHTGPHKDKTIPLLIAAGKVRPLLAHIIASKQTIDFTCGPIPGLNTYWVTCNHKLWHLAREIHKKCKVQVGIAPPDGQPPIWLAANARKFDIVQEMLLIDPTCDLTFAPTEGNNKDKQALWFIFNCKASKIRTAVINIFIFLEAPSISLPELFTKEFNELKSKQLQIREKSVEIFIETYPEIAPFIDKKKVKD